MQWLDTFLLDLKSLSDCSLSQGFNSENGHVRHIVPKNKLLHYKEHIQHYNISKNCYGTLSLCNNLYRFLYSWYFSHYVTATKCIFYCSSVSKTTAVTLKSIQSTNSTIRASEICKTKAIELIQNWDDKNYNWLQIEMAQHSREGKRWIRYDTAQNITIRYGPKTLRKNGPILLYT